MPYADTFQFEGLLADACLRHRVGNPYADIVLNPDEQRRMSTYRYAVSLARILKVSEPPEQHYSAVWGVWITKAKHGLERLEVAAKGDDVSAFLSLLKEVDWDHKPAADFIRAIDLSLEAGAHVAARNLAIQGAEIHFDDNELQKYARVLAPRRVPSKQKPSNIDPTANIEWLNTNKDKYKGSWVAIKDGELLGVADSYKELVAQVGNPKGTGILTTKLY